MDTSRPLPGARAWRPDAMIAHRTLAPPRGDAGSADCAHLHCQALIHGGLGRASPSSGTPDRSFHATRLARMTWCATRPTDAVRTAKDWRNSLANHARPSLRHRVDAVTRPRLIARRTPDPSRLRLGDEPQHVVVDALPVLGEVDAARLDPVPLQTDPGRKRLSHGWI